MNRGHIPLFFPKFHPELNPIERVGPIEALYKSTHKYSFDSLRKNIPLSYDTLENIENHFKKVRHFMFVYLQGMEHDQTIKI